MEHPEASASNTGTSGWVLVNRDRFAPTWESLPRHTVLAALPGWGRSTWMRQCRAYRHEHGHGEGTWLSGRQALEQALAGPAPRGTVYVDDAFDVVDAELWEALIAWSRSGGTDVVVATIDPPALPGGDHVVLHERELAFTADEIGALAAANSVDAPADLVRALMVSARGVPRLVRRQLERLDSDRQVWAHPDAPLEASYAADLGTITRQQSGSELVRLLDQSSALRRFSVGMLRSADPEADPDGLAAAFSRLHAMPFGEVDIEDETGHEVFEWSPAAWSELELRAGADALRPRLLRGLELTRAAGMTTTQLYYLLRLDDVAAAERLVHDELRLFLLATNQVTFRALLETPVQRIGNCPNLSLLLSELTARHTGNVAGAAAHAQRALRALDATTALVGELESFDRYRVECRRLFAVVSSGARSRTRAGLDTVMALLDDSVLDTAARTSDVAARLAAELYLPFWAAIQVDAHDVALRLAELMRAHANPASQTAIAEHLTALTQEIFAGLHLEMRDDSELGRAHSDALVLLEAGRDDETAALVRSLAGRDTKTPTRSASEAFVLIVRALTTPDELDIRDIERAVDRSCSFWDDGRASSFVTLGAAFACLTIGKFARARELAATASDDWFGRVTVAVVALGTGDAPAAVTALTELPGDWRCPRAVAVVDVLRVGCHLRLSNPDAAIARLVNLCQSTPAPIARFAFRVLAADDFAMVVEHRDRLPPPVADVIDAAAGDRRWQRPWTLPALTSIERELLRLLAAGHTNAEIAAARYVSVNTVRTQVSPLLRKFGVDNRREAVARAEALGMLDG